MPLPIVAVVGRPNVGKSTFVNRIAQADEAIVHEMRGVTRDRSYHEAEWNGLSFTLIDTGGIEMGMDDAFQGSIRSQAFSATREADLILFLVDGKTGINVDDEEVARILRRGDKPVLLVVNKMDTPGYTDDMWEFCRLGLGDPWPVSAIHGIGTGDLLDEVTNYLSQLPDRSGEDDESDSINVAIIGRPNAGKSSLTNMMTKLDRSIVSDVAGTTRDAVDTTIEHEGRRYTIVDTAGLRRKSQIDQDVEYYGFVRAMRAIDRADVALLVIDGSIGLTDQDQRVASYAAERDCAMVILLNKWDLVEKDDKTMARMTEEIRRDLAYMTYAPILFISAKTGQRVDKLFDMIDYVANQAAFRVTTGMLNTVLADAQTRVQPPTDKGRRLKIYYMTQVGVKPPHFVVFCNDRRLFHFSYQRYLENCIRSTFRLEGTPIILSIREKGDKEE